MMTFKEYLIESTIMSTDALKQAMSDYEQRGIGKPAITKPSTKRLKQMDKRKARRAGEEETEAKLHADKDRVFTSRRDPQHDVSIKRGGQRATRRLRGRYGKGNPSPNAAGNLDDIYRR